MNTVTTNNIDDMPTYFCAGDYQQMKQQRGTDKRLDKTSRKSEQQFRKARKRRHGGW